MSGIGLDATATHRTANMHLTPQHTPAPVRLVAVSTLVPVSSELAKKFQDLCVSDSEVPYLALTADARVQFEAYKHQVAAY